MNASMNLDVEQYSNDELCNLVNLSYPYDDSDIVRNCSQLKDEILNGGSLASTDKAPVTNFINNVQRKLLNSLQTGTTEQEKILTSRNTSKINNFETNSRDPNKPMTTYEVTAIAGQVNPIAKNIMIKSLNIDTKFRENYYGTSSTDMHITLPTMYKNVLSVTLRAIELPNTFYSISRGLDNNYFSISTNAVSNKVVTIPDGNYTKEQFVNFVNNVELPRLGLETELELLIDEVSQKTVIAAKSATSSFTDLTLNFGVTSDGSEDTSNPIQLKLGWMLGFRNAKYTGSHSYASEGLSDFKGTRYVFLSVDDYNNNVNDYFASAFTSSLLGKNILGRISLKKDAFETNTMNNGDMVNKTRNFFGPVDIQKLHIQLLDEYGRNINMNNMDYSFCLDFTCIYET